MSYSNYYFKFLNEFNLYFTLKLLLNSKFIYQKFDFTNIINVLLT